MQTMKEIKTRKTYERPSMRVVELKLRPQLLTTSGEWIPYATSGERMPYGLPDGSPQDWNWD